MIEAMHIVHGGLQLSLLPSKSWTWVVQYYAGLHHDVHPACKLPDVFCTW